DLPQSQWLRLLVGPAALGNGDVSGVSAMLPSSGFGRGWVVELTLTPPGAQKFQKVTATLACEQSGSVRRQLAIALDAVITSHPQMGENVGCRVGISGNVAQITG